MRIAIIGAGAVGGYFGARLAQAGHWVALLARGPHRDVIARDGLRIESPGESFTIRPALATEDPTAIGPVDVVLVAVKAWQVPDAARSIGPLLGPSTFVVPLQNGVEAADQLTAAIGAERIVNGLCKILSMIARPGVIRHAGATPRIEFGERRGGTSARVQALRQAFELSPAVSVATPDDIEAAVWEKFLFIAPFSGVGAVSRMPVGIIRRLPPTRALLEDAMREVHVLARARGVAIRDAAVARAMGFVDALPEDGTASMQRDILDGRPSELESQNGAVVRMGGESGVSVPVHSFLYASLLPQERRTRGLD